jgi:hypothetical protein
MGRSSVKFSPGTGGDPDIRTWVNADSTHSQVGVETYAAFKITKATVTTTSGELVSTPLTDRKKLVLYADPANTANIHYSDVSPAVAANHPPLQPGVSKEVWIDADVNIYAIAASGSQVLWIEEYA